MPRHESVWSATAAMPECGPLEENVHVDVCVIGGGIAGLSTAYHLCQAGKSVALLDDGPLASGMTGMTTGHLTSMLDDRYFELEKLHGADAIRVAADSHSAAIERIDEIVRREQIDCDFARLDGYLFLAQGDKRATLERELDAAHRAGLKDVRLVERGPYAWDTGPCLLFPRQGQFHPLKYLAGLAAAIQRSGGRIYCQSHGDDRLRRLHRAQPDGPREHLHRDRRFRHGPHARRDRRDTALRSDPRTQEPLGEALRAGARAGESRGRIRARGSQHGGAVCRL